MERTVGIQTGIIPNQQFSPGPGNRSHPVQFPSIRTRGTRWHQMGRDFCKHQGAVNDALHSCMSGMPSLTPFELNPFVANRSTSSPPNVHTDTCTCTCSTGGHTNTHMCTNKHTYTYMRKLSTIYATVSM